MTRLGQVLMWFIAFIVLVVILIVVVRGIRSVPSVTNFTECAAAGYPIMESYPRQCRTSDGRTFVEEVSSSINTDLIRVTVPASGTLVQSPLVVQGEARGGWYFEASFPVKLLDANGKQIGIAPAQAEGEWMTTEFVPFKATITFTKPSTPTGTLVLEKDNPSGLPENADSITIPVRFDVSGVPVSAACKKTGCSGQICSDQDVVSTCEFREEYSCYKTATCERQANGACGWTNTTELRQCLAVSKPANANVPSAPTDDELYPQ
jgi:hypothetical protein